MLQLLQGLLRLLGHSHYSANSGGRWPGTFWAVLHQVLPADSLVCVRLCEKAWLHSLRVVVLDDMAGRDGDSSQNLPGFVDLNDLACSRVSGFYALLEIRFTIS